MAAQRSQRGHGGACACARSPEYREERVAFGAVDPAAFGLDRPRTSAWWSLSTGCQPGPSAVASLVEPSMSVKSIATMPSGARRPASTTQD
jgi:hypothetical protein